MPNVFWLIAAQRSFLQACAPGAEAGEVENGFHNVSLLLANTFEYAYAVVVRDRMSRYRALVEII